MINTIRADFYRLFHSKGFFITQFLLIAVVVLSVSMEALGSVGLNVGDISSPQDSFALQQWTSATTLTAMSSMASFLLYFCLPLFVMTIGFDLSRQTYKNVLTSGISRGHFFLSKQVTFLVMSLMQLIFYYGSAFLTAWAKNGLGTFEADYLTNFIRMFGIQFLCLNAIFSIGMLLLYLTFSNVAAVLAVVVSPLLIAAGTLALSKYDWLTYFNFQSLIDSAWIHAVPEYFWLKTALTAAGTVLICSVLSYEIFKKKEL